MKKHTKASYAFQKHGRKVNQVPMNIQTAPCPTVDPAQLYAIVSAAIGTNCGIPNTSAVPLFLRALQESTPFLKNGGVSAAVLQPISMNIPTMLTNPGSFNSTVPVAGAFNAIEALAHGVALPTVGDYQEQVLAALASPNAAAGLLGVQTLAFSKSNGTLYGLARVQPIFGYMIKIVWTSNDATTSLAIVEHATGVVLGTIQAKDSGCQEAWMFIPAAAGSPSSRGGALTYGTTGTAIQLDFVVYDGGSAASSLGGWQGWAMPVILTNELFSVVVPMWNQVKGQFSRPYVV